jgi:hypothetical protein
MRKWMIPLMAAVVLSMSAAAAQAPVESISAINTTRVVEITDANSEVLPDKFAIFPVESKTAIQQEIRRLYDFVNAVDAKKPPIQFFMQEQRQMVQDGIPEWISPDALEVNEIISIDEINYDEQIGDVRVEFEFATTYETGIRISVLLGITHMDVSQEWDENTDWNTGTEWFALKAEVVNNGRLLIMFPQDVLVKMTTAAATTMIVFNEPF